MNERFDLTQSAQQREPATHQRSAGGRKAQAYARCVRPTWVYRLLCRGACLLLAGALLIGAAPAEAGTAAVTTCDETHLTAAIAEAGNPGTVTFDCDGPIPLSSTLTVSTGHTLTLDATGHFVTLSGLDKVGVVANNAGPSRSPICSSSAETAPAAAESSTAAP